MADAVSGDTIFLRDSVTENVTLTAGVNIAAWTGGSLNTPSITGTLTMTTAGTCNISGINLVTNSAVFLAVTGSAASIVNLINCYLNCTNNTGITFSPANTSAQLNIVNCRGNLATTGIAYLSDSSTGFTTIYHSNLMNTGSSTTASTKSAGGISIWHSTFINALTYSSSGTGSSIDNSIMDCSVFNTTALTTSGTGSCSVFNSFLASGTSSAISVGVGTIVGVSQATISSSNTNAITGAGTLQVADIAMTGSSSTINTTTITSLNTVCGGIKFNKEIDALNTYVVGTFTPTIVGTVTGTTTYSVQTGNYVKIGNNVTVHGTMVGSAATGTGSNILGGFPFTSKNAGNNYYGSVLTANAAGWTWPALTTSIYAQVTVNSATGAIDVSGSGAAFSALQMANAAFNMQYSITYQI